MANEPLPTLPFIIDGLSAALTKLATAAADYRARFPNLPQPPQEFEDAMLPALIEATGDPLYAAKLLSRAWTGILNNEAGYNRHHGGGA